MRYVNVLVSDASYHGKEALTYAWPTVLAPGTLVTAQLRSKIVSGVVTGAASRPAFEAKSLGQVSTAAPMPSQLLDLLEWMREYYPAPLGAITQLFVPRTLPQATPPVSEGTSVSEPTELPPLTSDQTKALKNIAGPGMHMLHGKTGTGKTRIYVELAKRSLQAGRSALILTPEIGLTSQLARDFRAVFGDNRVELVHSELTNATRRTAWARIAAAQKPLIIIGARSALFAPLANIGLIVVDEAHETAYKQEQAPHYQATTVAAKLASLHQATLVFGSATPTVADYFVASSKKRPIIHLAQIASQSTGHDKPDITLIDRRDKKLFSKSAILSDELIKSTTHALKNGEQVLLFLNRRGTARMVFCDQCGWQALCEHCDLPLIYHGDRHLMRCHTCNRQTKSPVSCPECGNPSIVFSSFGTKALMDEVRRLFPEARTQRFDTDNKRSEKLDVNYRAIHAGEVDILVGTQTLAKGLDLPLLSLVGVISADTGLSFPDFSAAERTFQMLSQVLGRVGRGHRVGRAIVQSYSPESRLLKAVTNQDWQQFYETELAERRNFLFPPFCYLLKLTCSRKTALGAQRAALSLASKIRQNHPGVVLEGPAPSFHQRADGQYKWQIIIKAKNRAVLLEIIRQLPSQWSYDIDPLNLL